MRHYLVRSAWGVIGGLDRGRYRRYHGRGRVEKEQDVAYLPDRSPMHRLDLLRPEGAEGDLPLIIYLHGGGWVHGSKEGLCDVYASMLASRGFLVANLNYRLAPAAIFPAQLEDVAAALEFLAPRARQYRFDPQRVFLCGDSAGANLAALTACIATNPRFAARYPFSVSLPIRGLGLCCGIYDFDTFVDDTSTPIPQRHLRALFGRADYRASPWYEASSALRAITPDFPPAFVLSSETDIVYRETLRLIAALDRLGVPHRDLIFRRRDRMHHVYHLQLRRPAARAALGAMTRWFQEQGECCNK